jgi:tetratricopeptide (TPR) repeat protein
LLPAPKPVDVASLPALILRSGAYANFTRLVFDWHKDVPYTVFPGAGKMAIKFQTSAKPDLSAIARFQPPWVKNAAWHLEGTDTVVEFETDADSGYHDFKDGTKIVLDILAPKTDASAYAPPGTTKPSITKIAAAAIKPGASDAQAAAIAATAKQLQVPKPAADTKEPVKPDVKTASAKPDAKPDTKTATAPPLPLLPKPDVAKPDPKAAKAAATPAPQPAATAIAAPASSPTAASTQVTESTVTPAGVILNFKGANNHPSAVFVRGLTAWIVLEDAANLDAAALKRTLGGFTSGIEASSSPGVSILRITLKQTGPITALDNGADLKVVIGNKTGITPVSIGFAREQDDPKRAALTTFLPRADKSFALTDPATGDILTVIPGASGYAMLEQRVYAEFAALPTASGLVITPYTDDLAITVAGTRVRIARPGGLSLTPPQTANGQTPQGMAQPAKEPGFIDFTGWGQMTGGSFLATERRLGQSVARLPAATANHARLELARFYLANRFASEATGLINLIQAQDPSLNGDAQLAVMRASADYMLGRYQAAHNDLAGAAFDFNPHAALWRGLTEAALENWHTAHDDLVLAGPVLKNYPTDWQARARLADANAALGIGRLELADAALTHLPRDLSRSDALEANLVRARIQATTGNYTKAVPLFAAVLNGGDERLAAQAIYYQVDAGLNAHTIKPPQAIDVLERLRFRWRGDALEIKTLRRLAGLYFSGNQYREGLKTLRVATLNFQNNDAGRAAQDDMRAAFAKLYLKGGADKMAPVEQLALFYDNVDLTPIGADGDEMIRRMADRLASVDLLEPAANLLAYQVDKRLDGVAKAEVSTRLAAIYLMDHKPQNAINALHDSQITGLPDQTVHDRLLLEARSFAALKQWDNALDLIAVDSDADTVRLRADIYWESGNWDVAGQKTEELLGARAGDTAPLSVGERAQVLRMAVAYSLANDEASLDRLRKNFTPKMTGTPDASAFVVLSQSIDLHGMAFREAAQQIASVDTLETFMKDFSKRHEAPRS